MRRDESASIGIGSMILFIAMLLVAAMISATILIMMEKGFKDQSDTADRTEGRGQIVIDSIYTYLFEPCWQSNMTDPDCFFPQGHHTILLFFHLGPGSGSVKATDAHYIFHCINEIGTKYEVGSPMRGSDFNDDNTFRSKASVEAGTTNDPLEKGRVVLQSDHLMGVDLLIPQESYLIRLAMYDNQNTVTKFDDEGCRITEKYDTNLIILIEGGRFNTVKLHFRSLESGQLII